MNAEHWNAIAAWVGIVAAALIGFWGIRTAKSANAHAAEALLLVKSAEDRADRLEHIATERRDVDWKWVWIDETDVLSVRNIGTDIALGVELVVDVEGYERQATQLPIVDATDAIGIRLTEMRADADRNWHALLEEGAIGNTGFRAQVRVTWCSKSGVPGIRTWKDAHLG